MIDINYYHKITTTLIVTFLLIKHAQALCGYPGRPAYGKLLEDRFLDRVYKPGDSVNYACEKGYYLRGRGSRTCMANGKWSGSIPLCDSPLQIFGEAKSPGLLKLYQPNLAIDNNLRTCFYSRRSKPREWTLDMMMYRTVLSVIITVPFASSEHHFTIFLSMSDNTTDNNLNLTRCSSFQGMFATQTQLIVCGSSGVKGRYLIIQDNAKNFDYFGLCEVKVMVEREKYECGEAEEPVNSYPIESHKGNIVTYRCKEGYQLEGPNERYCLQDGSWSHEQAICKEVTCKKLMEPLNGKLVINGPSKDKPVASSQAIFSCDVGFRTIGQNRLTCQSNGQWNFEHPMCIAVDCGLPKNVSPGSIRFTLLNGTTSYRSMAKFECLSDSGLPMSEALIICQEDAQWSKNYAPCDQQTWQTSETIITNQFDINKTGKDWNLLSTLVITILSAILVAITLLITLFLKRKYLSVKLITWQGNQDRNERCSLSRTLRQVSKRFGLTSDIPMISGPKCQPSLTSHSVDESTKGKVQIRIIGSQDKKQSEETIKEIGDLSDELINLDHEIDKTKTKLDEIDCYPRLSEISKRLKEGKMVGQVSRGNWIETNECEERLKRRNLSSLMASYSRLDLTGKRHGIIIPVTEDSDSRFNMLTSSSLVQVDIERSLDATTNPESFQIEPISVSSSESPSSLINCSSDHLSHHHRHVDSGHKPNSEEAHDEFNVTQRDRSHQPFVNMNGNNMIKGSPSSNMEHGYLRSLETQYPPNYDDSLTSQASENMDISVITATKSYHSFSSA